MSWPAGFPRVISQIDGATLQMHLQYRAAKSGDGVAAAKLVGEVVSPKSASSMAQHFPTSRLVFVHAEEAAGRNALPATYAAMLGNLSGLEVDDSIIQINRPERTGSLSGYKMAARVEFDGIVVPGRNYLLVDDFITQGGTFADLRDFIVSRGGHVVAATTLAAAPPVRGINPLQLAVLPEKPRCFGKEIW